MMARWVGWILVSLLWACASSGDLEPVEASPPSFPESEEREALAGPDKYSIVNKDEIVRAMEREMRTFLGKAVSRFEEIYARFDQALKNSTVPPKIRAVEKELADFYSEQELVHEAEVEKITDKYIAELDELLEKLEPQVWEIAFRLVGSEDAGTSFDTRTGIDEVDDCAEATLDLVKLRSGRDDMVNEGDYARYQRIFMDRLYKHDVEKQGRMSIYVSDPMRHHFRKDEDIVAITITHQRKGLDRDIPLELRQIVRNRIVRGGATRFDSKFNWDSTLGTEGGRLVIVENADSPDMLVSKIFTPRVNMDYPYFEKLKDFIAIRDYQTALINASTGEILDCVSWQFQWYISHFGAVAVEKGTSPIHDENAQEIRGLLQKEFGS